MSFSFIQKLENTKFSWKRWEVYPILFFFLIIHYAWSKHFPIADVEAYYWDWSRNLSLSYYDHPGAVAWLCRLGIWLTQDQNNLRFFVPIFSLISVFFLLLSMDTILSFENKKANLKQTLYLEILYNIIPVFSMQSFILMPDFSLLTCLSIVLFITLKIIKKIHLDNKISIPLVILLGTFSGLGFNSKYHMLPIVSLMVLSILLLKKLTAKQIFIFLITFILSFTIASIPTIYWNIENKFISFIFQLNHGFGIFYFNINNPISYIIESSLYITPVLYIYGLKKFLYIKKYHKEINFNEKLILIAISPVCGLFILFFISSFYDYVAPYWISPAFFLLIPFISIDMSNWRFNKIFIPIFLSISLITPTVVCFKDIRKMITQISNGNIGYKLFFWYIFTDSRIEKLTGITLPKSISPDILEKRGCTSKDTIIASLNWTWTSQLAYHLKGHPFIYNLNTNQKSFYSFRDNVNNIKNCKIIVISSEDLIYDVLHQIENINSLQVIKIKPFEKKEEYSKVDILSGVYKGKENNNNSISMLDD
jgi:Dolichyl-phosphate-mannose-protein mannosyltransferase